MPPSPPAATDASLPAVVLPEASAPPPPALLAAESVPASPPAPAVPLPESPLELLEAGALLNPPPDDALEAAPLELEKPPDDPVLADPTVLLALDDPGEPVAAAGGDVDPQAGAIVRTSEAPTTERRRDPRRVRFEDMTNSSADGSTWLIFVVAGSPRRVNARASTRGSLGPALSGASTTERCSYFRHPFFRTRHRGSRGRDRRGVTYSPDCAPSRGI